MPKLTDAQLQEVYTACKTMGFHEKAQRKRLFAGIDSDYVLGLTSDFTNLRDQLLSDLSELNGQATLMHATRPPFAQWLENAKRYAHPKPEARVFESMRRIFEGLPPLVEGEAGQEPGSTPGSEGVADQPRPDGLLFSWLHLSDIHFSHGDAEEQWDQELVLDAIIDDFGQCARQGIPTPDKILITGDLAYSGGDNRTLPQGQTEYGQTRKWLARVARKLNLNLTDVFMVPGNHDVYWKTDDDGNIERLRESIRNGEEKLDTALQSPVNRERLFRRHVHYMEFARDFAPPCAAPFWNHTLESRGLEIRLIGLDTALVARSDDLGKLYLGLEQWTKGIRGVDGALVIVLSHHPLRHGWLADEQSMKRRIRRRGHIHLCGHVHEGESAEGWAGGGTGHIEIIAGAAHAPEDERIFGHGYNIAGVYRLPDGRLELRVWPRKWSAKNDEFRPDVENVSVVKGYAEHRIDLGE